VSEFRILASTDIAEAGFLRLSRHDVLAPTGESFTRHVVHHPGAVVVVPIDDDRETTLMVRQYRVAVRRTLLESPAGKTDVEGEPPEHTARRELEEEIGRRAARLVALATCFNSPGFTDELTHIYVGLDLTEIPHARVGPEETAMTIERVPLSEIDALVAAGEIMHATSIIGLLLTRQYLRGEYQPAAR
jgi:8-oxo-dGTP pyrophosphatase MutT (NUDIX family)